MFEGGEGPNGFTERTPYFALSPGDNVVSEYDTDETPATLAIGTKPPPFRFLNTLYPIIA